MTPDMPGTSSTVRTPTASGTMITSDASRVGRSGRVRMAVASLVCGVTAAWAMHQHIQQRVDSLEAQARVHTTPQLVARFDLAVGDLVDDSAVSIRDTPVSWAHRDALTPDDFAQWEGATLAHPVRQGDPILATYLGRAQTAPLSARLGPGRRAVTIPVDDISSQAGLVQPGDRLDIYVSFERESGRRTALLLPDAAVVAVGQRGVGDDADHTQGVSTLTLNVSHDQAVWLVAARQAGALSAILREDSGAPRAETPVTLPHDLKVALGLAAPAIVSPPRPVPVHYGVGPDSSMQPEAESAPLDAVVDERKPVARSLY